MPANSSSRGVSVVFLATVIVCRLGQEHRVVGEVTAPSGSRSCSSPHGLLDCAPTFDARCLILLMTAKTVRTLSVLPSVLALAGLVGLGGCAVPTVSEPETVAVRASSLN